MERKFDVRKLGLFRRNEAVSKQPDSVSWLQMSTDVSAFSPEEILRRLQTSKEGLTQNEAGTRLESFGPNEVVHERAPSWPKQLLGAFNNAFILLLLALALISGVTGDSQGALIIAVMVCVSVVLRFVQEFRSGKAAERLKAMVRTMASVTRDRKKQEIPVEQVVPGDLVHLSAGDMVPADLRLLSSKDLFISQSALTGESFPVEKSGNGSDSISPASDVRSVLDHPALCFMGTNVISGTGLGIVVKTGTATHFGAMTQKSTGRRPTTEFDRGVAKVSRLLIRFMLVMVPLVFLINGLTKGNWTESFFFALAVAVGLTPEMLPMIVTANLARGAVAMSRKKVIVKRLNSIQNFGAIDILCSDKTGTLTQDKVVLERHLDIHGAECAKVLQYAYLNSFYQTGLKNLLDVAVLEHVELQSSLHIGTDFRVVDEIPFDFTRRRMSVVVESEHKRHFIVTKGAVEETLKICANAELQGRRFPFGDELGERAELMARTLNEDGLRVIAVAYREFGPDRESYSVDDESDMTLLGFILFLDPPKESASVALRVLKEHAVRVKILTGDNEIISRRVCREVGLEAGEIVLGSQVDQLSDEELKWIAESATLFAKVSPTQKARIIHALKTGGHVVGFLGDGINDAAALREADVGISVNTAVDIAKESADIILLEKNLSVLEEGVLEGRKTFGNIFKYIRMGTSSNFGNVFSVLGASAWLPFLPMLPLQLLVQNLLYDLSQTAIPFDNVDDDFVRLPRKWQVGSIARFMIFIGPVSSIFDYATFCLMWFLFGAKEPAQQSLFQSAWFVEGLLSQTLVVHVIRTARIPFLQSRASWALGLLTTFIMALGVTIPYTRFGTNIGLMRLPGMYFLWLALILVTYCVLAQRIKSWFGREYGYY